MVTTIYLVRHGETEGNPDGKKRYKGSLDVPLSGNGISQIKALSRTLSEPISAIYSSPLSRALKSAEIIAKDRGLSPIPLGALRERSFGVWEGMSFDEIVDRYPREFNLWKEDPLRFSPIGGESTIEVRERVMPEIHRLIERHRGETILIVAHGGVNRVVLCEVLGIPLENIFGIEQDFACLNIIEFWPDGRPVVRLINGVFR